MADDDKTAGGVNVVVPRWLLPGLLAAAFGGGGAGFVALGNVPVSKDTPSSLSRTEVESLADKVATARAAEKVDLLKQERVYVEGQILASLKRLEGAVGDLKGKVDDMHTDVAVLKVQQPGRRR